MNTSIYSHKHIVLCEDHYNPLGIIRSLGEEGVSPIVLLSGKRPCMIPRSKYIGELHLFNTIAEAFQYMVDTYGNESLKPFVYNGSDEITLLLDNNYDLLKDKFLFFNGEGELARNLQKYEMTKLAEECGILIPKEEFLKVGVLPTKLKYPVITKAATSTIGSWKNQSFVCENEEELKIAYRKISAEYILVQEYIERKNELCIDGISINGGDGVFMPYCCTYYRFPRGSYGNYMHYIPFNNQELTEKITKVLKGAKYSGIFCIEFLIGPDDNFYFLEVNYRHSGWSYGYTYGGYNLPVRWAISTLNREIDKADFKYLDGFDQMQELSDFKDSVLGHVVPLSQWIKEVKRCDTLLYYNKKDPKPFWGVLRNKVLKY